jgi:transglutaminase-like putative cysteine protease
MGASTLGASRQGRRERPYPLRNGRDRGRSTEPIQRDQSASIFVLSGALRTLAACALPALAVSLSWLRIEDPKRIGEALAVLGLALLPALPAQAWQRALAAVAAGLGAAWIAFGPEPWELLPFRDERVLVPVADAVGRGIGDFYLLLLPFEPARSPEMHALVLAAIFGFALASALLVAERRPVAAAGVTVAGVGWPATLVSAQSVAIGALALAAALSIPLILRARSGQALVAGVAAAAVVVSGAAWASSATTVAREAALNWETWDIRGAPVQASTVSFAWDSNYDGIRFPAKKTVVLTVEGPDRARYWRTSTLDLFQGDHWFEDLFVLARVEADGQPIPLDRLTPARAARKENWLEQRIEVKALVDEHLAAAGTPVALDSRRIGTVFLLSGGVLAVRDSIGGGPRYRVWSYVPEPAPAALAASKPRYPTVARRYLALDGRRFPAFGDPGREAAVRALFADRSFAHFVAYRPMYAAARRVAGSARTPYAAVLALESWFRQRGGFVYDEQPPRVTGPPLVEFVTRTKAGYCQHYAGAMAAMLRMLGIPARVAVGFTSGSFSDGKWIVTDHQAHAWVEVWFAGHGWVPFDPTPGRGTFGGDYSFASDSEAAVAALGRGELSRTAKKTGRSGPDIPQGDELAASRGPSLFGLVLAVGALWALAVGAGKAIFRRTRYLTRDPRRAATASRRELESFLRDQGIAVLPSATLDDLRRAVAEELGLDGRSFVEAAARARFGPPDAGRRDADVARQEVRALLRRMRFELSVWARVRGFVSLRSLRRGWQV